MLRLPETMGSPREPTYAGLGHPLRLLPPPKIIEITPADCWETAPVMKQGLTEGFDWNSLSGRRIASLIPVFDSDCLQHPGDYEILSEPQCDAPSIVEWYACHSAGLGAVGLHE